LLAGLAGELTLTVQGFGLGRYVRPRAA